MLIPALKSVSVWNNFMVEGLTTCGKYVAEFTRVVVPKPTTDVPLSLPTVPIPNGGLLFLS